MKIEEKAKVYDGNYKTYTELINRLEGVKDAIKKQNYGIAMDILCKPYPEHQIITSIELKESEDEKIREKLIDTFNFYDLAMNSPYLLGIHKKDILAWLEKQGELINSLSKGLDNAHERIDALIQKNNSLIEQLEKKQGEQNPQIKLVFPKFRVGDIIQHIPLEKWDTTKKITHIDETGYYFDYSHQGDTVSRGFIGFLSENDYELVEQKSADKVEPKFKKGDVIRRKDGDGLEWTVEDVHKDGYYNIVNSDRDDFVYLDDNWELVEHNLAWSEEDEAKLKSILFHISDVENKDVIDWLKGLKDRVGNFDDGYKVGFSAAKHNQWKPSDEQMEGLRWVFEFCNISHQTNVLKDLYNDLKKLREE